MRKAVEALYLLLFGTAGWLIDIPDVVQRAFWIFLLVMLCDLLLTRWYAGVFGRTRTHNVDVVKSSQARAVLNVGLVLLACCLDVIATFHGWIMGLTLAWAYWDHAGWLLGQWVKIRQHYYQRVPDAVLIVAEVLCPELHVRSHPSRPHAPHTSPRQPVTRPTEVR